MPVGAERALDKCAQIPRDIPALCPRGLSKRTSRVRIEPHRHDVIARHAVYDPALGVTSIGRRYNLSSLTAGTGAVETRIANYERVVEGWREPPVYDKAN